MLQQYTALTTLHTRSTARPAAFKDKLFIFIQGHTPHKSGLASPLLHTYVQYSTMA